MRYIHDSVYGLGRASTSDDEHGRSMVLGRFTRARAGVADGKQLLDVGQPQPEPLRPWMNRVRSTAAPSYVRYPDAVRAGAGRRPARS